MGCAGSKPEEEVPTKTVADDEMAAVRAKLAEAKAKEDAKAAEGGETAGSEPFRRKFKGFQAGGGSKHNIKRAVDMSPEAVAERERINAEIKRKREEREAKMNPIQRQMTRAFTRTSSSFSSSTRSLKSAGSTIMRSFTRRSSGSSSGSRSFTRLLSRKFGSGKASGHIPASELNKPKPAPEGLHDHGHNDEESSKKTEKSTKSVGFAAPEDPPDATQVV